MRLLVETLQQVVVVPTAAVQRGPNGTFVYVVDAESKVAVRPVTVAQQDDTQAVISDGLKAEERVVTTGFARLSDGTRVRVQAATASRRTRRRRRAAARMPRRPNAGASAAARAREDRRQGAPRSESTPATPSAKQ